MGKMEFLLVFCLLGILILTGCSGGGKNPLKCKVSIYDKANFFQPDEEKKIADELISYARQLRADISIVTDSTAELWRLPIAGDKAKDDIPSNKHWWQFWRYEDSADDIIFYYTKQPHLLQIRYGKKLRLQVRKAGLDAGKLYQSIQRSAIADDKNINFLIPIGIIKSNWLQYDDLSFLYRRANIRMIERVIENITLPDLKFWYKLGNLIPMRILKLTTKISNKLHYWIIFLFLIGWILKKIVTKIFDFLWRFFISNAKTPFPIGAKIGAFCFALLITLPSASVLALALSGRIEDQIALEAISGSALVYQIPIFPAAFASKIYWISAVLIFIFGWIAVFLEDPRLAALATFSEREENHIYIDMDIDEQELYEMKFRSLRAQSEFHTIKPEYGHSLEDEGITEEKFYKRPFSTLLQAKLLHESKTTIGRRLAAIIILPPYMGAWFLLKSIFEGVLGILKIPKAIKFKKYYSE